MKKKLSLNKTLDIQVGNAYKTVRNNTVHYVHVVAVNDKNVTIKESPDRQDSARIPRAKFERYYVPA